MKLQKWGGRHAVREWDPFKEMQEMQDRLEQMLEPAPLRPFAGQELMVQRDWAPLVDISEGEQEYLIKAELPEVKREDVKVSVENGVLQLSGERKHDAEGGGTKQHWVERSFGKFVRRFSLPDGVNTAKITAEFKDGLLEIRIPKDKSARPHVTEIKVS